MPMQQADDVRRRAACAGGRSSNGTSGWRVRSSIATNAASSATRQRAAGRASASSVQPASFGVDERVDEQREAGGHRAPRRRRRSDGARRRRGSRRAGAARAARRASADRHVDEQHPLPAGPLGQHAAEQHAGGAARAGDGAPDAERLVALGALGEGGRDDRQRGGGDERGAEALHGARGDQPDLALGEAAGERGEPRRGTRPAMKMRRRPSRSASAAAEQQEAAEDRACRR